MAAADTPNLSHRRVYGRGLYDGLRLAGISEPKEFLMKSTQLERREQALNGIARKVYDVMVMDTPMTPADVCGVLRRTSGSAADYRIVQGCLARLVESGLARETAAGNFIRIAARQKLQVVNKPASPEPDIEEDVQLVKPATPPATATTAAPLPTLDRLAALAQTMRQIADAVGGVAQDIETIALDVESRVSSVSADAEKLRQLQLVLKSIGVSA